MKAEANSGSLQSEIIARAEAHENGGLRIQTSDGKEHAAHEPVVVGRDWVSFRTRTGSVYDIRTIPFSAIVTAV
jgi:hypothetical protein